MIGTTPRGLIRDDSGKAHYKLVFGSCVVALAAAMSSPAFETNPLIGGTIHEMRQHLPETLDTIRRAMGG
jgi:hypothetical protein